MEYGLHWFRRDLRVAGNPGLGQSWKRHQGRVVGVFFVDSTFLQRSDFSHNRFAFFLNTLAQLKEELRSIGSDLLVLDGGPEQGFRTLFKALKENHLSLPVTCSFNRDYEPFAIRRDQKITDLLQNEFSLPVHTYRDHILIEPHEILKEDRTRSFYQVYTPYARRWFEKLRSVEIQDRVQEQKRGLVYLEKRNRGEIEKDLFCLTWKAIFQDKTVPSDQLNSTIEKNQPFVTVPIPPAGSLEAYQRLLDFRDRLDRYLEDRDFPGIDGTSQLSIYLKNGSLTSGQVIASLGLEKQHFQRPSGPTQFLKELVWREFYYQILFHCPRVENEAFLQTLRDIEWENDPVLFEAWKEGRTGYPIVDAGMRQLKQTGWMHNRVRMIVASFLTKDLLVNWQWGENYFMKMLLDGDLAPNNGGWQWAASTGCDPQPYFRVFNPTLQSEKFDPEGQYIRRYLPEMRDVSASKIHLPRNPIVDHSQRRVRVLRIYEKAKQSA